MSEDVKAFCLGLAKAFSDVNSILEEHLSDYDELLPHVFLGDVTRYVLAGGNQRQDIVRSMEAAFRTANSEIADLIALSFVENIESPDELNRALNGVAAHSLRQEWIMQHKL